MTRVLEILFLRTWWRYQPAADGGVWLPYHLFNLAEGIVWLLLAALVFWRWRRHRHSWLELLYAAAFALFGLTDFREAFALQSWLIWLKGINLAAILALRARVLREYYPESRTY